MVFTKKRNYILRLNITLSAKIALPAIKATAKIIGRLIVAPAIPVDIPISIDRPKVKTITMKAYQPGKVPYRTVAMQPVQTCTPRWLSFRQNGHWIVLFSMIDPLERFPAIAGLNKINHAFFRFIHPLDAGDRFFVHP